MPSRCRYLQVVQKNQLVTMLLDYLVKADPQMPDELSGIMEELTTLSRTENAKVSLRARQVRASDYC